MMEKVNLHSSSTAILMQRNIAPKAKAGINAYCKSQINIANIDKTNQDRANAIKTINDHTTSAKSEKSIHTTAAINAKGTTIITR